MLLTLLSDSLQAKGNLLPPLWKVIVPFWLMRFSLWTLGLLSPLVVGLLVIYLAMSIWKLYTEFRLLRKTQNMQAELLSRFSTQQPGSTIPKSKV